MRRALLASVCLISALAASGCGGGGAHASHFTLAATRDCFTHTGLSAVEASRAFERFFRGAAVGWAGSGLGLAIVREIAQLHGATVHVAHAHKCRGYRWATQEASFADMKGMVPKSMGACFDLIEKQMLKGPWVMGETYTICDPYLFTLSGWLQGDSVDIATLPKVADHRKRMAERPAVRKVLADES